MAAAEAREVRDRAVCGHLSSSNCRCRCRCGAWRAGPDGDAHICPSELEASKKAALLAGAAEYTAKGGKNYLAWLEHDAMWCIDAHEVKLRRSEARLSTVLPLDRSTSSPP